MKNVTGKNGKITKHIDWILYIVLFSILGIMCIGFILSGIEENREIKIVKNGTSMAYPNEELTYGNVFSEYFDCTYWETKRINDNEFVIFSGKFHDAYDKSIDSTNTVEMWFLINDDTYVIRNFTVDGCQVDMDASYNIINNAFINYMETHGIDCAEIYPEYMN